MWETGLKSVSAPKNIILMGVQGSGKGTQAKVLATTYGWTHVASGDLYRKLVKQGDPTALAMKAAIDRGEYFSDEMAIKLISENLSPKGNIIDGTPRSLHQAELLEDVVKIDAVIELVLDDASAAKRIVSRLSCLSCGATYGEGGVEVPPSKRCSSCGDVLSIRSEDNPDALKKRMEKHRATSEPIFDFYKNKKIFYQVDGSLSACQVLSQLYRLIEHEIK